MSFLSYPSRTLFSFVGFLPTPGSVPELTRLWAQGPDGTRGVEGSVNSRGLSRLLSDPFLDRTLTVPWRVTDVPRVLSD